MQTIGQVGPSPSGGQILRTAVVYINRGIVVANMQYQASNRILGTDSMST